MTMSAIKKVVPINLTIEEIKQLPIEKLKEIYRASFGLYPSGYHENNPVHYHLIFERELKFNRTLKHYEDYN